MSVLPSPSKSARALFAITTAVVVKLVFEISKKIFPVACTLIRAVLLVTFGTVIVSVPSFGVADFNTVGKVWPPSEENRISTLAALMGAAVAPETFQVTVWAELPAHDTAVFG